MEDSLKDAALSDNAGASVTSVPKIPSTASAPPVAERDIHTKEHGNVFTSAFDLWMPTLYLSVLIAFVGGLFDSALTGVVTIAVFFLGLIPQAKMKRADLVVQLQERFSTLASDKDASGATEEAENGISKEQKKSKNEIAARAFYAKFWNLQILEFGLWRYGMLPSDTYSHWIVRRLLSFRPQNTERYWCMSPLAGWEKVKGEFAGTDFAHFMNVAIGIGEDVENNSGSGTSDETIYRNIHIRIERLLATVSGWAITSTFVFRWFAAYRKNLRDHGIDEWKTRTMEPLARESRFYRALFVGIPAFLILPAFFLGARVRPFAKSFSASNSKPFVVQPASPSAIILDSESVAGSTFVIRFAEEGGCATNSEPRRWRGAMLTASGNALVSGLGKALAACDSPQHPVSAEVVGFASSADFKAVQSCRVAEATSTVANLKLANARAENVTDVLRSYLPLGNITMRPWQDVKAMETSRNFVDRAVDGTYNTDRGSLNRRVEIRIINAGECGPR